MGSGIAAQIKREFLAAYTVDLTTKKGDRSKLGTCTFAKTEDVIIVNAYTQYDYGRGGRRADYDAIRSCFKWIKSEFSGLRIGIPFIGAGLAGGDWNIIKEIIDEEMVDEDITVVKYKNHK